jgi:uncharacterized membrane protein
MSDALRDSVPYRASSFMWRWWLMQLLALAGIGVSGYLTWTHLADQSIACGQSQDCDIVQQSVYSEVAGIPVALLGLAAYTVILVLTLLRGRGSELLREYIPLAIFGISLVGMLYSAYLTYLELFVIYAICRWCVSSAIIIVLIFLFSLSDLKVGGNPS